MRERTELTKIGLATIVAGRLLVVRKRGKLSFILPGGKPEAGEQELDTLAREIEEELGCTFTRPDFEGRFADVAAELPNTNVVVVLYSGQLAGTPIACSEIEELAWLDLDTPPTLPLAPSITNHILPHLRRKRAS